MEPLLKPKPPQPFETPFQPVMIPPEPLISPWNPALMGMQGNSIPQANLAAPVAQAGLTNYLQQTMANPQWPAMPANRPGMMMYPTSQEAMREAQLSYQMRQHFLQQQRLNHNHERLLERYQTLTGPRATEFRPYGTSVLPGRNYNGYLDTISGAYRYDDALASMMRNRIFASPSSTKRSRRHLADKIIEQTVEE